jgi:hypothetical protein
LDRSSRVEPALSWRPDGDGSSVEWFERVTVPYLPKLLAPIVNKASALGFASGMRRLAKIVEKR